VFFIWGGGGGEAGAEGETSNFNPMVGEQGRWIKRRNKPQKTTSELISSRDRKCLHVATVNKRYFSFMTRVDK
jgi:hypothetical protein